MLWFWQNQSGFEIDFLIEKGGQFIAFESKLKEFPDENDLKNFTKLEEFYGKGTLLKGFIVCKTSKEYPINKNISAINGIGINF
jgi:predicted AAA+ superfamily ATPase